MGYHEWASRALAAFHGALYPRRPGRWLRGRLEAQRRFPEIPLRLARGGAELDGLRVALISDLHAGCFMTEHDLCRIFERVAQARPDLVCLVGDLIESRAEESLLVGKALPLLQAPLGVFAVPGNHEHRADPGLRLWRHCLEEHGVTVLLNQGRRLRCGAASLWLAGLDDLLRGEPDLPAALDGAREEEPVLLLAHHPDHFAEAASAGIDLTLSGHTHGGQITWRGRTLLRHSRLGLWHGHHRRGPAQLYVSRGVGTTGLPLRVHAPGELPLIRLRTRGD